ncbi:MAG: T9SS type A sorting domain-containing protein [Ignavibacteriae bacterium]|nr:T9SS type A sorting domain-containing protein [Ignavibacteriota bacterium]
MIITKYRFLLFSFALLFFLNNPQFAQEIFINEFMASNATILPNHNTSDWIELYNDGDSDVNLNGYYLTDNLSDTTKWQFTKSTIIKTKGFIILYANGNDEIFEGNFFSLNLNFKLNKDREEIGLYNPQKVLIDSILYDSQITDVSFGRKPNGENNWYYFGESTPGSSNITAETNSTNIAEDVEFSLASGVYENRQQLLLSANSPNAVITYTTDGSTPSSTSIVYNSPLQISSTTIIRARTFEVNKLPGKVFTKSFFIKTPHSLPIVSINTTPDLFFANGTGIYNNQIVGKEVPINFELLETDNSTSINSFADAKITGQASFVYPQKSLTISAKNKYGNAVFKNKVFQSRELDEYSSLYLRNSGTQDIRHTMFRDALQHSIVINQMDIDVQAYRPVVTYINGEYWGIYNLREKLNEDYLATHHNVDPKNIDYLEYDFEPEPVVIEGNSDEFNLFYDYIRTHNINDDEVYNYVKSQIDINEIMNYLITEIYCDNVNWPYTNIRWWREKKANAKWRFILLDLDYGFGAPSFSSRVGNNTFEFLFTQPEEFEFSTLLFRKLLQNFKFREEFVQRFAMHLNTTFHRTRVEGIVDSIKGLINSEMPRHIDRWDDNPETIYGYPPIPDMVTWNNDVEIMLNFARLRPGIVWGHLDNFFLLNGTETIQISNLNSENGKIYITDIEVKDGFEGQFFKFTPLKIKAVPSIGYRFVKWEGIEDNLNSEVILSLSESLTLEAIFEKTDDNILPSLFATNTSLDISGSPYYANGDVIVKSSTTLTVEEGVEIIMPPGSNIIVEGNIILNGTENNPIQIKENQKYGYTTWGTIFIKNATDSSLINHVYISGATNGNDEINQIGALSILNSKVTISNTTIENVSFPIFAQNSSVVVRNCNLSSNTTSDLINIKNSDFALIENCELRGNNSVDVDAIDYDNIKNGIIRGNRIYNFFGINSDGIDLGEGSSNILIEDNLIYNCYDKGISVGQASTASIKHNIIVNCTQGVGIKDFSSYAEVNQNTFYGCDYGIACFEKNIGAGGGTASVVNTIFYQSKVSPVLVDAYSTLTASYSIYDIKQLEGIGNKKEDPLFANNFSLMNNSPAINSGDPNSERDPDGSVADIGAVYFSGNVEPQIIINEILYKSDGNTDRQFIELYNAGLEVTDLSNLSISGAVNFVFPIGTSINSGEYLILAKNENTYLGQGYQVFQWSDGELSNRWNDIKLINQGGKIVDLVTYNDSLLTSIFNSSIELISPSLENLYQYNWQASSNEGGTPGSVNLKNNNFNLFINEIQASNTKTIADEFEEFDDWIEIYNATNQSVNINGLYITDNYDNLTKYKLQSSASGVNTIDAKGFYLIWADENSPQGNNHTNFKLSSTGEQIALVYVMASDTTIIDSISFGNVGTDISYARINDGNDEWKMFANPTPGYINDSTTDIIDDIRITSYSLSQNYPNPFNPTTTIQYAVPELTSGLTTIVLIKIYDILGREVATLVNEEKNMGLHKIQFDASSLASGIYFYTLRAADFVSVKKMIILK